MWPRTTRDDERALLEVTLQQLPPGLRRFRWLGPVLSNFELEDIAEYLSKYPWRLVGELVRKASPKVDQMKIRVERTWIDTVELWEEHPDTKERILSQLRKGGYHGKSQQFIGIGVII